VGVFIYTPWQPLGDLSEVLQFLPERCTRQNNSLSLFVFSKREGGQDKEGTIDAHLHKYQYMHSAPHLHGLDVQIQYTCTFVPGDLPFTFDRRCTFVLRLS